MERTAFFTSAMGARLREIRRRRGLTLEEVAARMGISGAGAANVVSRLESGKVGSPMLRTVAMFLRACGAKWSEFSYLLERVELPIMESGPGEETSEQESPVWSTTPSGVALNPDSEQQPKLLYSKPEVQREIIRKTQDEAGEYAERIAYPRKTAPMRPAQQARATAAYQEYRLQANTVKQRVQEYLDSTDMGLALCYGYQKVAERTLGALRRADREGKNRARLVERVGDFISEQRLDEKICRRVQEIVTEVCDGRQVRQPTADS